MAHQEENQPKVPIFSLTLQVAGMIVLFAVALFWPAGTLSWTAGWLFWSIMAGCVIAVTVWLVIYDPDLVLERMSGMSRAGEQTSDKILMSFAGLVFFAWLVSMPLDAVRFHLSHVPMWLQGIGGALFVASWWLIFVTYRENRYLSIAVRVQKDRGHTVVSTGPYRFVRHPLYAAMTMLVIGGSLMLGSLYGLICAFFLILIVAVRAVSEERMLSTGLPGYLEYMEKVRFRFVPGIW